MALIIPPQFAQVTLPFKHASVPREAVITFGVDGEGWGGDYVGLANFCYGAFANEFGAEIDSEVTMGPARLLVGQDGGDPLAVVGTGNSVGSRTASMMPQNVALLVQKRSLTGGKRGRGRFYIPWILRDEEVVETGLVDGTALAAFQDHATTMLDELASGGGGADPAPMVILHDSSGLGPEPGPSEVVSLTVDPMVATQRRRLGRG